MKNLNKNSRYFILVVSVGLLMLLVLEFNNRIANLRRLEDEAEEVSAVVNLLEMTHAALETQIAYATLDAAVEDWAYEEAHMIREGDHPIAPIAPQESTPAPVNVLPLTPQPADNWQIWKALFFEESFRSQSSP